MGAYENLPSRHWCENNLSSVLVQRTRNRRRETHRQHHHHLDLHSQQHPYALLHALPPLREGRNSSAAPCHETRLVWSGPRPEATSETRICAIFGELRFGEVRTMRLLGSWTKLLRRYRASRNQGTSARRSMPEELPTPPAVPCNHF